MGPGLSVYVHNLLQPRIQVAQVFIIRRVFIGCPCALGSLSSQPRTPLSRLAPFSRHHSFVLLRAHLHFALALGLLASPRGGVCVCVCVCNLWSHKVPGGCPTAEERASNKEALQVVLISARTLADVLA